MAENPARKGGDHSQKAKLIVPPFWKQASLIGPTAPDARSPNHSAHRDRALMMSPAGSFIKSAYMPHEFMYSEPLTTALRPRPVFPKIGPTKSVAWFSAPELCRPDNWLDG